MQDKPNHHASPRSDTIARGLPSLNGAVWRDCWEHGEKDPAFLAKLVSMFVQDSDQRLATMSAALVNGKPNECARAAHALAAGCLQIGATGLAKRCLDIECAVQDGTTDLEPQLLQRVRDEYQSVKRELEDALSRAGISATDP